EHGRPIFTAAHVLGEGAASPDEHVISHLELLYVFADRFNGPREVDAKDLLFWFEQPERRTRDVRLARQEVPVNRVDRGSADADQHSVTGNRRPVDVLE